MKIRDLEPRDRQIRNGASAEEACEKLLAGKSLYASSLNGLLYHYGFLDEDAICISVECQDCPFVRDGSGCVDNSSAYVRDLMANKITVREPIDVVL